MDKFDDLYKTYGILANALLIGLAILVGAIAESALTYLEVRWDKEREAAYGITENWYAYLASQPVHEPVGFRYIGRKVTSLYFELSMMVAAPLSFLGLAVLTYEHATKLKYSGAILLVVLAVASIVFFYKSARRTHLVLCQVRKEIVARMKKPT